MYVCMYVLVIYQRCEQLVERNVAEIPTTYNVCMYEMNVRKYMYVCMYVWVPVVVSLLSLRSLVGDANTAIAGISDHLHAYIHTYIH